MRKLLIISLFFLTSCSSILSGGMTFNGANYNYDYLTFNKRLNRNNSKYLLNVTNLDNSKFNNGTYYSFIFDFFKEELKENVVKVSKVKDGNGKLKIVLPINYDISIENIEFLKENTDFDFIILTKIQYLEELDKGALSPINSKRLSSSKAGAVSYLKILDLRNQQLLIEMSCTGDITINEARDLYDGVREFQPKAIHKDSYSLGEKAMKKLLKKIK
jgi:hypothetical protein